MVTSSTRNIAVAATLYFVGALAVLVLVCVYVSRMGGELNDQLVVVANNNEKEQELNALNRLVEDTTEEREHLKDFILSEGDTISFLTSVEQLARNRGVTITTENLSNKNTEEAQFDTLEISYKLGGTFLQLKEMIEMFETLPYHGSVDSVRLRKEGVARQGPDMFVVDVIISLSLIAYD